MFEGTCLCILVHEQIPKSHLLILEIIQSRILKDMRQGQNSKPDKSRVFFQKKKKMYLLVHLYFIRIRIFKGFKVP
ncbi:hypothetical protein CMV_000253 [Castanea mollissima]|uniref:Uncharacterized protein n=1 Tax=Castanea mollissima TaxID=60419 RepID=A0A8J4VXU7_9ROSI|nr:hypothetical protein CMV_000253 [Castanea mollissima]